MRIMADFPEAQTVVAKLVLDNICCEIDDRVLFSGLSAEFSSGDLVQIVGPNGAGKTTLLRILTGLSSRYSGTLAWCTYAIPSYEFFSSLLYLGHDVGVKSALTPLENLDWYFGINGIKSTRRAQLQRDEARQALASVGLAGYEEVPCHQMSAGQQRRVALARLYLSEAPLWILDEPFTAIDKQGVLELEQRIQQHRDTGGIVLLTTHQALSQINPLTIDLGDYIEVLQ